MQTLVGMVSLTGVSVDATLGRLTRGVLQSDVSFMAQSPRDMRLLKELNGGRVQMNGRFGGGLFVVESVWPMHTRPPGKRV